MAFRPLSAQSDFEEALRQAFQDAREVGFDLDQIIEIVRKACVEYEREWEEPADD